MDKRFATVPLTTLNCPACSQRYIKPIKICESGHSLCSTCSDASNDCTLCLGRILETRNLVLQDLIDTARYPCKNKFCKFMVDAKSEGEHEDVCCFAELTCPNAACDFKSLLRDMGLHWQQIHGQKPFKQYINNTLELSPHMRYSNLVLAFDSMFLFNSFVSNGYLYFCMEIVHNKKDVNSFSFNVGLYKDEQSRSRIRLGEVCIEYGQPPNLDKCACIPISSLVNFIENGSIKYFLMLSSENKSKHNKKNEKQDKTEDEKVDEAVFFNLD